MEQERLRPSQRADIFWVVPLGGLFIIFGLTLAVYPDVFQRTWSYFRLLAVNGRPLLPPYSLGQVIMFFFNVAGVWGLVSAGLRFVFGHPASKAVGDVMGGFFAFFLAYILSLYYRGEIAGISLIPLAVVGLGIVIVVNAIASHLEVTRSRLLRS